jgi:hypothetical protein
MGQVPQRDLDDVSRDRRSGLSGIKREVRLLPSRDGNDHRFSDCPRYAEHECGSNAGDGRWEYHPKSGFQTRCAHCQRPVPQTVRHRPKRIFAEGGDIRNDHDTDDDTGAQDVEAGQVGENRRLQERRDKQQREKAEDDGRNAAQQFQYWLYDFSKPW